MKRSSLISQEILKRNKSKVKPYFGVGMDTKEEDDEDYDIGMYVEGRNKIISQLKELNKNIDTIGIICDNKKKRTNEENSKKFFMNKALIDEELAKIKFKLSEALKNSEKEDLLKKLQNDFTAKKNQVSSTDKQVQNLNKIFYSYQHKLHQLKEDNNFLKQEIQNSDDYNYFLSEKKKELEKELKHNKVLNVSSEPQLSEVSNEDISGDIKAMQCEKLKKYFSKLESMYTNKLMLQEKLINKKYNKLKNLNNFHNQVQDIMKSIIKNYQKAQVDKITEKMTNREIFFSLDDSKDLSRFTMLKNNLTSLKNKFEDNNKLNGNDKKEIMKMVLENEDMKKIIFNYFFE